MFGCLHGGKRVRITILFFKAIKSFLNRIEQLFPSLFLTFLFEKQKFHDNRSKPVKVHFENLL